MSKRNLVTYELCKYCREQHSRVSRVRVELVPVKIAFKCNLNFGNPNLTYEYRQSNEAGTKMATVYNPSGGWS